MKNEQELPAEIPLTSSEKVISKEIETKTTSKPMIFIQQTANIADFVKSNPRKVISPSIFQINVLMVVYS